MYEFSKKEIRSKFKKTEYGKKVNKTLYISIVISVVLFLISVIIFIMMGAGNKLLTTKQDMWLNILFGITAISVIISCYFDGKRDGAIEQFKCENKKQKK